MKKKKKIIQIIVLLAGGGKVLRELVHELLRGKVVVPGHLVAVDAEREVLGHGSGLDGVDDRGLQVLCKLVQVVVAVKLGPVEQAAGPGKDRGHGVGRGLLALLVEAPVPGNSAVGGLGLDGTVGREKNRGHKAEGAKA